MNAEYRFNVIERGKEMKYTVEDINRFREYVALASDYVGDAKDTELEENLDDVLDYLVHTLDAFYPEGER